jgi:hypothetical protein
MTINKLGFLLMFALVGMFFVAKNADATTATFDVTEDTFINEAYPDNNYGSVGSIVVSNVPIDRYGFLQFENVSLPAGAVVDDANLELYIYDHSHNDDAWVRIGLIGGSSWEEDDPTWNGPYPGPIMSAGNFNDVNLDLSTGWKEIDVTDLVSKWLSGEKDQRGLYIYPNSSNDFTLSLRSKEHGSNIAAIEVEYHVEVEEEYDFDLVSPEDDEVVRVERPVFEWTEIDEDSDIDDYLLIVNMIIDDGDDVEEVVDEKISEDETEYQIDEDLEEGEYRWYMAALRDDESSIHRTESWEFTVNFAEEEDEVEDEVVESDVDQSSNNDYIATLAGSDESSDASGQDNETGQEGEQEEQEKSSMLDNFLYLLLGIGLAIAAVLGYQEYMARKKKKENYKGLVENKKENKKKPKK